MSHQRRPGIVRVGDPIWGVRRAHKSRVWRGLHRRLHLLIQYKISRAWCENKDTTHAAKNKKRQNSRVPGRQRWVRKATMQDTSGGKATMKDTSGGKEGPEKPAVSVVLAGHVHRDRRVGCGAASAGFNFKFNFHFNFGARLVPTLTTIILLITINTTTIYLYQLFVDDYKCQFSISSVVLFHYHRHLPYTRDHHPPSAKCAGRCMFLSEISILIGKIS